jgi:ribonuclease R
MTYTAVKPLRVDKDPELCRTYDYLLHDFELMEELCRRLMAARAHDGSIDFDLPEPEIILDLQGQTTDIIREERHIAHRMVEEFMLAANRTVAEHMTGLKVPFIYRIHDVPDPEKIQNFIQFIGTFGLRFANPKSVSDPEKIRPKAFQSVLEQAKGRPEERLINHVLLRTMKQAKYSTQNVGHFGLAFDLYTHFTSPIRRYPDLIVHRLIKEWLHHKGFSAHRREGLEKLLPEIAQSSSERERASMEAEREAVDLKKVRFLADKEGEEFFGFITGVTAFGFFVELEEMFVEGLVHISSIPDDYYIYEEKQHRLIGRTHRRIFRLADRVKVRVEKVDLIKRQADFRLVEEEGAKKPAVHRPPIHKQREGEKKKRRRR